MFIRLGMLRFMWQYEHVEWDIYEEYGQYEGWDEEEAGEGKEEG